MFETIFIIYIVVVILPISCSRIIRWVDIDDIYLPLMGIAQGSERMQIVSLNQNMIGVLLCFGVMVYLLVLHFRENRNMGFQYLFSLFWLVLPYQTVTFSAVQ